MLPQSRQHKICNSQGLTNQDRNLLYVKNLASKSSQNRGVILFFAFYLRDKMADPSCCFCFHFSLTCPLPPGFVIKKCNGPVDALSQFLCALQYFPLKPESQSIGYLETWHSFIQHGTQNPCSPGTVADFSWALHTVYIAALGLWLLVCHTEWKEGVKFFS